MNLRILVADDDPLMRTLVAITLSSEGEVVEAGDGNEALHLLREGRFDLLLLDWDMPGVSGLDVLKTMRRQGCDTLTIMVTGKNEREHVIRAVQAGVSDYLIKPFESDVLYGKVKKVCESISARKPSAPNCTPQAIDEGRSNAGATLSP